MEQKIVLTGIARSKGKAAGEAAVNRQRMGWAFNHVGNEDGIVLVPGADLQGQIHNRQDRGLPHGDGLDHRRHQLVLQVHPVTSRPGSDHLPEGPRYRHQRSHCRWHPRHRQPGPGPDHDHQDRRLVGDRRAEGRPEGHGHDHAQGVSDRAGLKNK